MYEQEWVDKLEKEGYKHVAVVQNGPNSLFPEHTHEEHTVHVILEGELTLIEEDGNKTLKKDDRFEIPAGTTHSAKCGPEGCTFVVGVKK